MLLIALGLFGLVSLAIVGGGAGQVAILLPWLVLALAVSLDFAVSFKGRPRVEADLPGEVFIGEAAALRLRVAPAMPGLRGRIDWPEGLRGPADFAVPAPDAEVRAEAVRRGVWTIDRVWLSAPSRLGLLEFVPRAAVGAEIRVVPNIRLVQSGTITTQVNSALFGIKENRAIGEGSEFHQFREFVPGMDIKTIDWKRSARYRSLIAKELRAERNHHVIVAIDNGYLMREEIGGLPKIDHATTAALATAWAAALGGDLVGFFAYDARPRLFMKPEPGRRAFARIRSRTADLAYVTQETNHTLALTELNARTPKRSLVIIFSDFIDSTTAELLVENIAVLARRHVIIFVAMRDPDMEETVQAAPDDLDGVAAIVAAGQAIVERQIVLERLARLGVSVIDAKPAGVSAALISKYIEIKAREMI